MKRLIALTSSSLLCLFLAGGVMAGDDGKADAWAMLLDGEENELGKAHVKEGPEGVVIRLSLEDLAPGWKAIHIHEKGTCEDHHEGFVASGGHVDPEGPEHGLLNPEGPEAGDLPNIWVHQDGRVKAELYAPGLSLSGEGNGLLSGEGTALVIHEQADDHQSQPIGGAGSRVACGVLQSR